MFGFCRRSSCCSAQSTPHCRTCHSSSSLPHSCNISLSVILVGQRGRGRRRGEVGVAVRAQIKIKLQVPIMCEIPTLLACLLLCALNEVALATHTHTHDSRTHLRLCFSLLFELIMRHMRGSSWLLPSTLVSANFRGASAKMAVSWQRQKKAIKNAFDAMPQADKIGRKALPVKRVGVSNQRDAFKCN